MKYKENDCYFHHASQFRPLLMPPPNMRRRFMLCAGRCLAATLLLALLTEGLWSAEARAAYTNSAGIRMLPIAPGTLRMGETRPTPKAAFGQAEYLVRGDWDEHPVHEVAITQAFFIAEEETTVEQFRQFRADYRGVEEFRPHAAGVSW